MSCCGSRTWWSSSQRPSARSTPSPTSASRCDGRDARAGRRVGLRQVDHRPGARPGAAAHLRARWSRGTDLGPLSERDLRQVRTKLQMIFQDPISSLNPRRRVRDIVAEPLVIWEHGHQGGADRAGSRSMLEAVGIDPDAAGDRRPLEFSGGQCQRICIARALMLEPEAAHLRRARVGSRRVGAGPDPQPARGPQGPVRPDHGLHRPRPGRGQERERPGGRHVPGQAVRGGRRRRPLPAPAHPYTGPCWPPSPSPTPISGRPARR